MAHRLALALVASVFSVAGCDGDPARSGPDGGGAADAGRADAAGADAAEGIDAAPACALADSPPIAIAEQDAVVENLRIDADGEPAITISAARVTVRNVQITHRGAPGISIEGAADVVLENVSVERAGAPASGPLESADDINIVAFDSPGLRVNGARLARGSSGIYVLESPRSELRRIQGEDFRGPFPRGQLVQWDKSSDGLLDEFSVVNTADSWPEDNVNVYRSSRMAIRNGFIDGNNAPSGVGVIFDGGRTATGTVEDVDAIHMGNGCFSAYAGGDGAVFRRTRCRDNICEDQGRGAPLSNALMWSGREGARALRIEESTYFASCNGNVVWPDEAFAVIELVEAEFTPRPPLDLRFCWE
jgi:hypothetical protein